MKPILVLLILATGVFAMTQTFVEKLKPAKEEIQEQPKRQDKKDTRGAKEGETGVCTRNNPDANVRAEFRDDIPYEYVSADGKTYMTKHCIRCRTGVYSHNQDENIKHCSFCGAAEE